MAQNSRQLSLEYQSRLQMVKLTINVIENALAREKLEEVNRRERDNKCQRKRSYSCGDDQEGELPVSKFIKVEASCYSQTPSNIKTTKRSFECVDTDNTNVMNKRQKIAQNASHSNSAIKSERPLCPKDCAQDDRIISYCPTSSHMLQTLKRYFIRLSPPMWNEFGKYLMNEILRKIRQENVDIIYLKKAIECIFCEKLSYFSTVAFENISSDIVETVFEKLRYCWRLTYLEMSLIPNIEMDVVKAITSFERLKHLRTLSLLPPTRSSFHWALEPVARHCSQLHELRIVYNGDLVDDGRGITHLRTITNLTALWLFNFGRQSETNGVSELLRSLPKLKVLFHKELPNAILDLHENWVMVRDGENEGKGGAKEQSGNADVGTHRWCRLTRNHQEDGSFRQLVQENEDSHQLANQLPCQLEIQRLDLCWYQHGVGYQLVYVPSSYLIRVAQTCPHIRVLNLVGPPCLAQVIRSLPCLQVIILQQASLTSCLKVTLQDATLDRITELRLTDVWDVTYDLFSAVATQCSSLQILSVISSSLEARGELTFPPHRPAAFPCLREATLVPAMLQGRPSLTTPSVWQLGASLTSFLLRGTSQLTSLHLEYRKDEITLRDTPMEQDLTTVICQPPRPKLCSLILECPPETSPTLVEAIVEACAGLSRLGRLTTWPLTPDQGAMLLTQYGNRLDIS